MSFAPREAATAPAASPRAAEFEHPLRAFALLAAVFLAAAACTTSTPAPQPNLLLVVIDDLGVEGLRSYGGEHYETPNLDALAGRGVRFERAFATPMCVPSRAELITGQYPFRSGWSQLGGSEAEPKTALSPALPSVARSLREAGYATAVAGKWHLAPLDSMRSHPHELGFDTYRLWRQTSAKGRYWSPSILENGVARDDLARPDVYGPDSFTDFVLEFIEQNRDRPWFVYYPMILAHRPFVPTPATARSAEEARLRGKPEGFTDNREQVAYADATVGRLWAEVERLGLADRTFLLVTSDNGTDSRTAVLRGGRRIPGGKFHLDESGAVVPLLVRGPAVREGAVASSPVDFTDFLPTLLELAGAAPPEPSTTDGRSFAGALRGQDPAKRREWAYVQFGEGWFLSDGRFRLQSDGRFFDAAGWPERPPKLLRKRLPPEAAAAREHLEAARRELRGEEATPPSRSSAR